MKAAIVICLTILSSIKKRCNLSYAQSTRGYWHVQKKAKQLVMVTTHCLHKYHASAPLHATLFVSWQAYSKPLTGSASRCPKKLSLYLADKIPTPHARSFFPVSPSNQRSSLSSIHGNHIDLYRNDLDL